LSSKSTFGVDVRFFTMHAHVEADILIVGCRTQRDNEADNLQQ
jgi:hypothetical protein